MTNFSDDLVLYEETILGGWNWSHLLKRGTALRLTDLNGGACAALLAYNPIQLSERYNMPDSFKAQFTSFFTTGHALYSDMGRILLTILADSAGGHESLCGVLSQKELENRFGIQRYQEARNSSYRSGQLALLTELAKYDLNERDIVPNVNFFSKTIVQDSGKIVLAPASSPESFVDLQAEMDTLVILTATQHPLDSRSEWAPHPVKVTIWNSRIKPEDNPAYRLNEQNSRGFFNTNLYEL